MEINEIKVCCKCIPIAFCKRSRIKRGSGPLLTLEVWCRIHKPVDLEQQPVVMLSETEFRNLAGWPPK